jgi:hypothetical protein
MCSFGRFATGGDLGTHDSLLINKILNTGYRVVEQQKIIRDRTNIITNA